eukprot:jgi/Botrbrau1/13405/Bobra.0082s0012.1
MLSCGPRPYHFIPGIHALYQESKAAWHIEGGMPALGGPRGEGGGCFPFGPGCTFATKCTPGVKNLSFPAVRQFMYLSTYKPLCHQSIIISLNSLQDCDMRLPAKEIPSHVCEYGLGQAQSRSGQVTFTQRPAGPFGRMSTATSSCHEMVYT